MKTTITIPLNDRDPVEVEATIVAGVMAVHQQEWDGKPQMGSQSHRHGMTFGILWLTSEQDAIEAAHMAAQSEAILDTLAGKTRDECLDRTGDLFHPAIQAIIKCSPTVGGYRLKQNTSSWSNQARSCHRAH